MDVSNFDVSEKLYLDEFIYIKVRYSPFSCKFHSKSIAVTNNSDSRLIFYKSCINTKRGYIKVLPCGLTAFVEHTFVFVVVVIKVIYIQNMLERHTFKILYLTLQSSIVQKLCLTLITGVDQSLGSTHFLLASDTNSHAFNAGHAYQCPSYVSSIHSTILCLMCDIHYLRIKCREYHALTSQISFHLAFFLM